MDWNIGWVLGTLVASHNFIFFQKLSNSVKQGFLINARYTCTYLNIMCKALLMYFPHIFADSCAH
jgi:hypothetical protein